MLKQFYSTPPAAYVTSYIKETNINLSWGLTKQRNESLFCTTGMASVGYG